MNVYNVINLITGIVGVAVIIFGFVVRTGAIAGAPADRSTLLFILGAIILLWSFISYKRHS